MKRISFLVALFLISMSIWAQNAEITGIVSEGGTNQPLIGVTVSVKGKQLATSTNFDGQYTIAASPADELVFTYMGMSDITEKVGSRKVINVEMQEDNIALEQVVVIGYGTVRKSDLTGAVSSLSAKDLQADVATSATGALQGRIAGVSVTNQSGQPGSGMNINIRGITSMSHTSPLYVIDGVYGDINLVDPSDIQSLEVLKDASASAIYGSRAANGVVLITTKTGKRNTPSKISLNFYTGIQQLPKKIKLMNGEQWASFVNEYEIGGQTDYAFSGKGTDWQDEVYRTASIYKANMGITGGSETSTYSASVGYLSQDGIMITTDYEAINARLKNDFTFLGGRLKIGESILFKTSKQNAAPNSSVVHQTLHMPSTVPVYDDSRPTGWGAVEPWMTNLANPVGSIRQNDNGQEVNIRSTEILFNGYLSLDIWDGLSYKLNTGLTRYNVERAGTKGAFHFGMGGVNDIPDMSESRNSRENWLVENTLNYNKTFGKHNVYALAGYSSERTSNRNIYASMQDIPVGISTINGGIKPVGSSYRDHNSTASMFGRLMYSYDSRYMFSASIRRDGSSRFAHGHRWGNFPSASLGWNINNESFAAPIKTLFDELKVRVSYGKLGNQEIGNYQTQRTVTNGINYVQGGAWWKGSMPGISWVSPEDLTWESSETSNIGLDATLFKGKLSFTMDAYIAKNKNILMGVPMAPSVGLNGSPTMNAGTFENKGIELAIMHRNQVGNVFYSLSGNVTFLNNKMKEVNVGTLKELSGYDPQGKGVVSRARLGYPVSGFFLLKSDGIFQTEEEVLAHVGADGKVLQKDAKPGDIRFLDTNGDGVIDKEDVRYMGTGIPKTSFGFRANAEWKGFDIGMFFDGVLGNKIYNNTRYRIESSNDKLNYSKALLNSWTPNNTKTGVPRFGGANLNNETYIDRWLEKGDFFRLKTLEFGYTLPKNVLQKIKLDNVRVYTSFENLFILTAYKGYTPDVGSSDNFAGGGGGPLMTGADFGRYPMPRTMSLGIQVNL